MDSFKNSPISIKEMLHHLPGHVYCKDVHGVYIGCNHKQAQTLGFSLSDQIVGKRDKDLYAEDIAKVFESNDQKVIKTGEPMICEEKLQYPGGEMVTLSHKIPLTDYHGNIVGILGVSLDITEMKNIQLELKQAKHLAEAASGSKSEFIAHMSHDVRTPITGVLAMGSEVIETVLSAQSILEKSDVSVALKPFFEKIREDTNLMMGSVNQLLGFCNEVLQVVQIESGQKKSQTECFDLDEMIDKTMQLLKPVAVNKKLKFFETIDASVPKNLIGHRHDTHRSLINLLSNALKFTHQGFVKLTVKVENSDQTGFEPGSIVRLKFIIEDSGIGIPEDKHSVIFENFSRLKHSYEGTYQGSGLGLYAVKRYVESMRGSIEVDSTLDKGSCFTLILPFIIPDSKAVLDYQVPEASVKVDETSLLEELAKKKPRVLLVEDDALAAIGAKRALMKFHCQVDLAKNGEQAITLAKRDAYDLIVLDIGLPDIDGTEVAETIRRFQDPRRSQVPIVALTGHAGNADYQQSCFDVGIQAILNKPADKGQLAEVLQKYLIDLNKK